MDLHPSDILWVVALVALVEGAVWFKKHRYLAWPSFCVAGVASGYQLQSSPLVHWSVGLTVVAIAAQTFQVTA